MISDESQRPQFAWGMKERWTLHSVLRTPHSALRTHIIIASFPPDPTASYVTLWPDPSDTALAWIEGLGQH